MPRDEAPGILDAKFPLHRRLDEIAQLAKDSDNQLSAALPARSADPSGKKCARAKRASGPGDTAEGPLHRFLGLIVGARRRLPHLIPVK